MSAAESLLREGVQGFQLPGLFKAKPERPWEVGEEPWAGESGAFRGWKPETKTQSSFWPRARAQRLTDRFPFLFVFLISFLKNKKKKVGI